MDKTELAKDVAAGLAGWLQLQIVQKLGGLSGEDSARLVIAQIINAQGRFLPATSQLPPNWGNTKSRIDIALKGRTDGAVGWYGAIEVKWPGTAFDVAQARARTIQDAMRLAFVQTNNLNAHFLVVGGSKESTNLLFDKAHDRAPDQEGRRVAFCEIFSRDIENPSGKAAPKKLGKYFPDAGDRVPSTIFGAGSVTLKTKLLAKSKAWVGGKVQGYVFVWQCNR